jgi:2',3'-cyclic-nucleotide 2'-phosphodiesterase (5'-nucleotidase family)
MKCWWFCLFILLVGACSKESTTDTEIPSSNSPEPQLTIFFINDQQGEIDNFSKIKSIVDDARQNSRVILACAGDIFSGNPVVDNHEEKGFPMIDLMNQVGFDICVLGNHEFDYGEEVLGKRMAEAHFDWVCANIDMGSTGIPEPAEYATIQLDSLRITFLGLVETNGKPNAIIPLTHPWRVQNLEFQRPEQAVVRFDQLKEDEEADLFIALTHLGHSGFGSGLGDFELARQHPYFDLIIGGHSHRIVDTVINNIPIFQAGSHLRFLGRIDMIISDRQIKQIDFNLVDLDDHQTRDQKLATLIDQYNDVPELNQEIGYSHRHHDRSQVGCFYTDALRGKMEVDLTLQNVGGVRSALDEGPITRREIFEISPFNNGTVIYSLKVEEVITFLRESRSSIFYSGVTIEKNGNDITLRNSEGALLDDTVNLTLGINDYIPAVFDNYFPSTSQKFSENDAESIIEYLMAKNLQVDYPECTRFFRYE